MRLIRRLLTLLLFSTIIALFLMDRDFIPSKVADQMKQILSDIEITQEEKDDQESNHLKGLLEEDFPRWIGASSSKLLKELGEPLRQDLSAFGYEWWVYTDEFSEYVQFGIHDQNIETIYVIGNYSSEESTLIGQSYENMSETFKFENMVTYRDGLSTYKFHLTTDDLLQRPLVKISDHTFIQFYFDTFTNQLSSYRILTAEILLKHMPYELDYRGDLPERPNHSPSEWLRIEEGTEQQIFDITNIIRNRHGKSNLIWEESIQEVAYIHSKDMSINDYFSHDSLDGKGLKDRLAIKDILYQSAGENIAAQYPDGPAVMEGWLNSEGHRNALLEEDFTHLGVGVYQFHFTQNFISR